MRALRLVLLVTLIFSANALAGEDENQTQEKQASPESEERTEVYMFCDHEYIDQNSFVKHCSMTDKDGKEVYRLPRQVVYIQHGGSQTTDNPGTKSEIDRIPELSPIRQ